MIPKETVQDNVLKSMDGCVLQQLPLLRSVAESWQPSDFLPDSASPAWDDDLRELRKRSECLSDAVLVVLVGNLVTEEALPSYQTWLNRVDEIRDETGASDAPWAQWTRGWTAEENRHGDLLSRYLYLSGRVNMRSVDVTVQHLIKNGFDLRSDNDPYRSLVYAAFQERATKISHSNTGRLAEKCGDEVLERICSVIAGDEARHEEAYKRIFREIIRLDPSRAVSAAAVMLRGKIAMPARFMSDGSDREIFTQFAITAQRSGVYTTRDYANVISHLVDFWQIASLSGLSDNAARDQEYLCGLADRYLAKAAHMEKVIAGLPVQPFSWIFERTA